MSEYTSFADEVFGGAENHWFCLLTGKQLIDNKSFENDLTGWNGQGSSVISRVNDVNAPFGDYALKINDNNAAGQEYGYTDQIEPYDGDIIENKLFLVTFWAKADTDGHVTIEAFSNDSDPNLQSVDSKICSVTADIWKQYWFLFAMQNESDATEFNLRFHPYEWLETESGTSTGIVYIDFVRLYKVGYFIDMVQSSDLKQDFTDEVSAQYKLAFGNEKRYIDGKRYKASISWDILSPANEQKKSAIMGSKEIFFIPHKDYDWGVFCYPSKVDGRRYLMRKYIGHVASIALEGLEVLDSKVAQLMSDTYTPDWDFNFASMNNGDNLPWNSYRS